MIADLQRREYEIATAYDVGLDVPRIRYNSAEIDGEFIRDGKLLIEKINGIDAGFTAFWNGEEFSFWTVIINDNKLLNGSQGPNIGSNCITVFPGKIKKIQTIFERLIGRFSAENYRGFITLDVIIKDGKFYYDRIRFNILPDVLYAVIELSGVDEEELIIGMESGRHFEKPKGFACSLKLWDYPYSITGNKNAVIKYSETHELIEIYDSFIATSRGDTIKKTWKNLYKNIADIDICYRTDGDYKARWTFNQLKRQRIL